MEKPKIKRIDRKKTPPKLRPHRMRMTRAVTPAMLLRSLKAVHESHLNGIYFSSMQITEALAKMYPEVEQEFPLLHQEVQDKLLCAASAEIIGLKFDRGYYLLTDRACCAGIDTRSKLMFWMLYKKMIEERSKSQRSKPIQFP